MSSKIPDAEYNSSGGSLLWGATKLVGKATAFVGYGAAVGVGMASMTAGKLAGKGALAAGAHIGSSTLASLNHSNPFRNPIGAAGKAMYKGMSSLVKYEPAKKVYNSSSKVLEDKGARLKMTKKGLGLIFGASVLGGMSSEYNSYVSKQMGTTDTAMTTATPNYQPQEYAKTVSPIDHAGATGDLVFALNANRRG